MIGDNGEKRLINYRPLFEFALGMMAGILLCGTVYVHLKLVIALILAPIGFALHLIGRRRLALLALAALVGFTAAFIALPVDYKQGKASICGIVCGIEEKEGETLLTLDRVKLYGYSFNKRARLTIRGSLNDIKIGDGIEAEAEVRKPSRNFSTYDERKTMLSKRIGCIAETDDITVTGEHLLPFTEFVCGIRSSIEQRIRTAFGEDSGIFTALLLGVRSELSAERAEAYRSSGTAHLLAISGFHMGIIVGAISLLIPKRRRVLRFAIILIFSAAYCTIAAYTPGIVRAAIMTACLLASSAMQRRGDMLSSLSLAAILILLFNPFQIYSIGFRLSFSAVFGIALFAGPLSRWLREKRVPGKLSSALAASISASAATLMFQLRYYSSFTPYSVLANLFAVPAFSVIIIFGFAAALISFILPSVAPVIAVVPRAILFAVEKLLSFFSNFPLASVEFVPPSETACLLYLVLLFAVSEYVLRRKRERLEYAVPILMLFTFAYFMGIIKV